MIEKEFRYTKTVIQTSESSVCASSPVLENVFTSKKENCENIIRLCLLLRNGIMDIKSVRIERLGQVRLNAIIGNEHGKEISS